MRTATLFGNMSEEEKALHKRRLLSSIPFFIGVCAFACSYVGSFHCDNVQFVPSAGDPSDFFRPRRQSYGLWYYRWREYSTEWGGQIVMREGCGSYVPEEWDFDAAWKAARAFSCLSIVPAAFLLMLSLAAPFLLFDALFWQYAIVLYLCVAFCQGMTLLFLRSNACLDNPLMNSTVPKPELYPETCSWAVGARASLASVILWIAMALSMVVIPAPGTRPEHLQYPMMIWDNCSQDDNDENDKETDLQI